MLMSKNDHVENLGNCKLYKFWDELEEKAGVGSGEELLPASWEP